jgi:hypothetical protein
MEDRPISRSKPGRISAALRAQRLLLGGDGRGDLLVGRSPRPSCRRQCHDAPGQISE